MKNGIIEFNFFLFEIKQKILIKKFKAQNCLIFLIIFFFIYLMNYSILK